jgi:3-dehydroquinate synthase
LAEIIGKCAKYKSEVVERDEFERGERRMLNLGHTFAHSIEKLAGGEISHGYAVSMGMVLAAKFADALSVAREGFTQMLINDLRSVGLPALLEDCPLTANFKPGDLAETVGKDKKVTGNSIRFILPKWLQEVEDIQIPLDKIKEIADDLR